MVVILFNDGANLLSVPNGLNRDVHELRLLKYELLYMQEEE
jgi:hypothetical protein